MSSETEMASGPSFHITELPDDAAAHTAGSPTAVSHPPHTTTSSLMPPGPSAVSFTPNPTSSLSGTTPHPLTSRTTSKNAASQASLAMAAGRSDYLSYQSRLRQLWPDPIDLTISYTSLAYDIPTPVRPPGIPNLAASLLDAATLKSWRTPTQSFLALQPSSGIIRPSTMTLILAPPGHGKSTLLKALAGRYAADPKLKGSILYNGRSHAQLARDGLQVSKLTAFVDQGDVNMALLTVRETLQFALDASVADAQLLQDREFVELSGKKVDFMLELLGLKEAEHTVLGNAMIRGVSGGQRRRVTLGEMMITNARALFLDEITTGLDSAASFDILSALKQWCRVMKGSTMVALLQPTPECFALFDRLVMLRHGAVVYDGPLTEVEGYLASIGVPVPDDVDLADYLSDFLTDPKMVYYRTIYRAARQVRQVTGDVSATAVSQREEKEEAADNAAGLGASESLGDGTARKSLDLVAHRSAPLTTHSLQQTYQSSAYYQEIVAAQTHLTTKSPSPSPSPPSSSSPSTYSPYTHAQFGSLYAKSWVSLMTINLGRSAKNMRRNGGFWGPRMFQAIFLGFILGGLFYNLGPSYFQARLGLCLFAAVNMGFANAAEIPFAAEGKDVVFKQLDAGFYSSSQYVWSVIIVHLPLSIAESILFSLIIYFLSAFDTDAGRFFFFLLAIWCTNVALSAVFRAVTYATRHQDIANQMSGPIVATFFLVCGYLILYNNIPRWLIWLYWMAPFTWVLRSLAINEFNAPRYDAPFTQDPYIGYRTGDAYMRLWDIDPTSSYKWAGIGYLIGFFFVMMFLCAFILARVRYPLTIGTRRFADDEDEEEKAEEAAVAVQQRGGGGMAMMGDGGRVMQGTMAVKLDKAVAAAQKYASSFKMQTAATALPFTPVDLAWRDIHYTVQVEKDGKQVPRKLLTGISGYARAGQLTALMGSSGAGKTTLMDVIAGRKTAGVIEGEILVNGYPKITATFNRMCGYVEQTDNHLASQTVREALHFSAKLRLPRSVTEEQRHAFVSEVLDILELTPIADRVIGDVTMPGLSPGQMKRVTIGVELVSNPPVLFLDEPTSGLDSRAALIVMRVVKRISMTGRSVLCTIHQPSAELFYLFDRLLLLKTGGTTVYFGDLGTDGSELVRYFEEAPLPAGVARPKKGKTTNPASWMLEVIGAGTGMHRDEAMADVNYASIYTESKLRAVNQAQLDALCLPKDGVQALEFDHVYASSYAAQVYDVTARTFQYYWRNPQFVWWRQGLMLFLSCFLGFLYLQLSVNSPQDAVSKMSAVFVGIAFPGWTVMTSIIPVLLRNRVVYYREQSSYMYSPYAYAFAISVVEIFYTCLSTIIFMSCFYPMVGFALDGTSFFRYFLVEYLVMLVWISLGQLAACALPNILVANILSGLLGTFSLLFSGLFIVANQMPAGWKWSDTRITYSHTHTPTHPHTLSLMLQSTHRSTLPSSSPSSPLFRIYYMDWVPKALIPIASVQFSCDIECATYDSVTLPDGSVPDHPITSQDYIYGYLDFDTYTYWPWIGWQLLTLLVFRIFIFMAVAKVNYMKR